MAGSVDPDFVIVSDLHLSAGYDPRTRVYDRNEDFFYDAAFARFVDHLLARAAERNGRLRLVILGDFVDFLQVGASAPGQGVSSSAASVLKLEHVARGHPALFAALGRVIGAGHQIDLVVGNHDIEFAWPDVQRRLREIVARSTAGDAEAGIVFHPWFLYVPGLLYAEHGHQYEAANSFFAPLAPWRPDRAEEIDLPLGSLFVLDLYNETIERIDPFADNVKPATAYFGWVLRSRPLLALRTLPLYLRFVGSVVRKAGSVSRDDRIERRRVYREGVLAPAERLGLPIATLEELDRLAETPTTVSKRRQINALLGPALPYLPALAGGVGLYRLMQRLRPANRVVAGIAAGLGVQAWRERGLTRPATEPGGYLYRAARAIDERLRACGGAVPVYVFGHDHTAGQFRLSSAEDAPWYLNTGTWTPILQQTYDLFADRERFTFVRVARSEDGAVEGELLVWNDNAGRAEPVTAIAGRGWPSPAP